ncbi:MAG: hypothetical protein ISS41_10625 [Candidatus Aminicenantes bacterium]|nr:hypothetical protein [Candidatus Aminicenantes bacterium]
MKARFCFIFLTILGLTCSITSDQQRSLSGTILYEGTNQGPVNVQLFLLDESSEGRVRSLSKRDIYGARNPYKVLILDNPGSYCFSHLPPRNYSVLAFMDLDKDGRLDFQPSEPFGWYPAQPGGRYARIDLRESDQTNIDFFLRTPTSFPREDRQIEHGALRWIRGLPVLQLWGKAEERGYAHGYLVGKQIIDFFEFYILEDSWGSVKRYEEIFIPFLKDRLNCPKKFLRESEAAIQGMKDSGIDMRVHSLGREFKLHDLLAINAYIERRAAFPVSTPSSCTQFAFWRSLTQGSQQKGGLIAARNMDGECDVRKVTASHFLLFAVDPAEPECKRWFSAMWPGFVGTISGINEDGLYSMENAGGTGPGPVVGNIVPCSWVQRYILEREGRDTSPEKILNRMEQFKCEGGGVTAPGSIILWAVPFHNQDAPAFVYEGDRSGGAVRIPTQVRPIHPHNIMASNHHKVYGYNPDQPELSFGKSVSFSSHWRYETGMNQLEAWCRTGKAIGLAEAKRLLQIVSHGTTEYSVIFAANQMHILVAVDDLKTDMWDAPYLTWKEYKFEELFAR